MSWTRPRSDRPILTAERRRRRSRKWRSVLMMSVLALGLVVSASSFAKDDDDDDNDDDTMSLADKAEQRFPQPVLVGALIHRTVLEPLESQPILGHVDDVVKATDGTIKVVVRYGGFLGFGGKPIAVPVDGMVLSGQYMEIVDFTPDQLDGFPRYDGTGTTALPLTETIQVGLARPSH